MKKSLISLLLFFSCITTFAQAPVCVAEKDDDNYKFNFLKSKIGNSHIVCLGESEHDVETYTKCKTALIKYLRDSLNFIAIAFEGSFTDIADAMLHEKNPEAALKQTLFKPWQTEAMLELFKFIYKSRSTAGPIRVSGFDIEPTLNYKSTSWLTSVLANYDATYAAEFYKTDTTFLGLCKKMRTSISTQSMSGFSKEERALISTKKTFVSEKRWNQKDSVMMPALQQKTLENYYAFYSGALKKYREAKQNLLENRKIAAFESRLLEHFLEMRMNYVTYRGINDFYRSNWYRDSAMAKEIEWLAENAYKGKKFVIWANDAHISKKTVPAYLNVNHSSVEMLPDHLKKQAFTISLNHLSAAGPELKKQAGDMKGNAFFVDGNPVIGNEFEGYIYFKETEPAGKHKLK